MFAADMLAIQKFRSTWYFHVLLILLMSAISAYSKTPPKKNKIVYARQLTVENGLSSNLVFTILRDSKNFTWVGTVNGLNKYDGHSFRHYFHKSTDSSSIQSNVVKAIVEDKSGVIWVGTEGGLDKLDRNTDKFTHYRFNSSNPGSIGSDNVTSLFVDSKGRLWIGLGNGELDYFEPRSQKFWRYTNVSSINFSFLINAVTYISEGSHGILYVKKQRGTVVFDPSSAECVELSVLDQMEKKYVESAIVIRAPRYNGGLFWENAHSIYSFKSLTSHLNITDGEIINSQLRISLFEAKHLIYRSDSILWNVSSYGIQEINVSSSTILNVEVHSLKNTAVKLRGPRDGFTAKDGAVWIASENGIVIIEQNFQPIDLFPLPEDNNTYYSSARSLCLDNHERLWVGASKGRLYYADTSRTILHEYFFHNFTNDGALNRMSFDDNNFLWIVGTRTPLLRVDVKNNRTINFVKNSSLSLASTAHSLLIDGSCLWTGSKEEVKLPVKGVLNFLTLSPLSANHYEYLPNDTGLTSNRIVLTIVKKDENALWLGTAHGLFLFDIRSGKFIRYAHDPKDPNSISGDNVWAIQKDRTGKWWIGTYSDGLNLFDEKKQGFTHFTIEDGMASNSIRSILEDISGNLWISTDHGISYFDQIAKTFTNYGISDGLLDLDYEPNSAAISRNGKMYFGGAKGVVSFFPDALKRKYVVAPLFISGFRIANNLRFGEIPSGSSITLDYTENDFSIEFAKLDYLDPEQKQYEYMLKGFDPEWISSGTVNIARYNNIEPGKYTFRFREKNDTTISFASAFIISPAFWMTWWFKSSMLMVFVFLTAFLYRRRIRKLKEFQVQLQLASENERIELSGELHDGPLQDLYGTRFMLDPLIRSEGTAKDATKLDNILKKVRADLRTLTGDLQIPAFDLGFAVELRLFCDGFGERHPAIQIVADITNEVKPIPIKSAQNLFRIFRTAMANIAEHANASKIEVSFVTTSEFATLKIVDDGIGFTVLNDIRELSRNKHYGLFLMQNYASSMNGKCLVSSVLGKGSVVEIIIPFKLSFWRKMAIR